MKKETKPRIEKSPDWLADLIQPTLRALKDSYFDEYQMSRHIQKLVENELYDMWIKWTSEQEVKWTAKNKESFILWLKAGCPCEVDY